MMTMDGSIRQRVVIFLKFLDPDDDDPVDDDARGIGGRDAGRRAGDGVRMRAATARDGARRWCRRRRDARGGTCEATGRPRDIGERAGTRGWRLTNANARLVSYPGFIGVPVSPGRA